MWQLRFNEHLFDGVTEGEQLRYMIASLGPPPKEFVLKGRLGVREVYFDDDGEFSIAWHGGAGGEGCVDDDGDGDADFA